MCGRVYETYTDEELYFRYLSKRPLMPLALSPIYNLCPTQNSPVLRLVAGERQFDQMRCPGKRASGAGWRPRQAPSQRWAMARCSSIGGRQTCIADFEKLVQGCDFLVISTMPSKLEIEALKLTFKALREFR